MCRVGFIKEMDEFQMNSRSWRIKRLFLKVGKLFPNQRKIIALLSFIKKFYGLTRHAIPWLNKLFKTIKAQIYSLNEKNTIAFNYD